MALLERVATLVRANLNDLIDKAEDPEKMIKQVILDMQNQLMQVKTQVAISIADQHLLEKKQKENQDKNVEWVRKAELAVDKKQDDLARAALERSMSYKQMSESFNQQIADQRTQVENLKSALQKLEQKLAEARGQERHAGGAAPARAGAGQGERCADRHWRRLQGRGLRPHAAQGDALRGSQPGKIGNGVRQRGGSPGRARKRGSHR